MMRTIQEKINRAIRDGNMADALDKLVGLCKDAADMIDEIEQLAEACDIGYCPYTTIEGGYYLGVESNLRDILTEARRLKEVRS